VLLAATLVLYAGDRSNNLLALLLGGLWTTLILAWALSDRNLRRLSIRREHPVEVIARVPFTVRLVVENRGLLMPAWSVVIEDAADQTDAAGKPRWLQTLLVPPRRESAVRYAMKLRNRGPATLRQTRLWSAWPLGIFDRRHTIRCETTLLVLPRSGAFSDAFLHDLFVESLAQRAQRQSFDGRRLPRRGDAELHGIREYRHGDEIRKLHHRATAHHGVPMIKELDSAGQDRWHLLIDTYVPDNASEFDLRRFEAMVSAAATMVAVLGARGEPFRLHCHGLPDRSERVGGRPGDWTQTLRALAVLARTPGKPLGSGDQEAIDPGPGATGVFFSLHGPSAERPDTVRGRFARAFEIAAATPAFRAQFRFVHVDDDWPDDLEDIQAVAEHVRKRASASARLPAEPAP
jgi:uncharacterized protein (DUF58 family)